LADPQRGRPAPAHGGLLARGQSVALSQIRHPHLSWREWRPGDVLIHGGFGVSEPGPDAPEVFPQALLVPLAAFDRGGGRLGYGQGPFRPVYRRTVRPPSRARDRSRLCGQEIAEVPREPHDRLLDIIVTETGLIRPTAKERDAPHPEVRA
jgi:5-formyltetrahydrofolate cyclo-ligase